jgi:hypothetical protein
MRDTPHMRETTHRAFASLPTGVLQGLHPAQANRRPALFILQVTAALLSVLALRDGILGGRAVLLEAVFAVGLWGALLAIVCGLSVRMLVDPMPSRNGATKSLPR